MNNWVLLTAFGVLQSLDTQKKFIAFRHPKREMACLQQLPPW